MPTFTGYPALQGRTADVWGAMQRGTESAQMNQLNQLKIGQMQAEQQRQSEMAPLMAQAAGGDQESLTELLGRDPGAAKKIIDARNAMSQMERDKIDRQREEVTRSIAYIKRLPEIQRPSAYQQERQRLQQIGMDMSRLPETYNPAVLARAEANSLEVDKLFAEADATKPPKIETFYTDEGGSQKKSWNSETEKWENVGGTKPPDGGATPKGLSPGEAYNALLEYKSYVDAGETPPAGVTSRASAAAHVLETKQYRRDAQDRLVSFTPGVPEGFPVPGRGTPAEAGSGATKTRGLTVEQGKVDVRKALGTLQEISKLLMDPANKGGFNAITGVVGTAKRLSGGLARQALGEGAVSPAAANLQRLLLTLQAQVGPLILNEKKITDVERQRLNDIVGSVEPFMDDVELQDALVSLFDFIIKYSEE